MERRRGAELPPRLIPLGEDDYNWLGPCQRPAEGHGVQPAQVCQHAEGQRGGEPVQRHRGIIIDFVGDAVLAVYGAPLENPAHALDAVRTGLATQAGLVALNARWQARGLPTLKMGIGIHTGSVFAGNVGAPDRIKYAVIGDTVNVAARVEGLNKELGTAFLITEDTYAILPGRVQVGDRGEMKVKGRHRPVRVYEVFSLADPAGSV